MLLPRDGKSLSDTKLGAAAVLVALRAGLLHEAVGVAIILTAGDRASAASRSALSSAVANACLSRGTCGRGDGGNWAS